jgi:hypothetical protein
MMIDGSDNCRVISSCLWTIIFRTDITAPLHGRLCFRLRDNCRTGLDRLIPALSVFKGSQGKCEAPTCRKSRGPLHRARHLRVPVHRHILARSGTMEPTLASDPQEKIAFPETRMDSGATSITLSGEQKLTAQEIHDAKYLVDWDGPDECVASPFLLRLHRN